jgi:bifunctional DNA-binding transcriptional regulator/antitoxin component of YhaV-PrlF toxin-antitoxin module
LRIGPNGEIIPPKDIRERLGFQPDQPIILYLHKNQLIIRRIHSLEELLSSPSKIKISYHVWKQFKEE